MVSNGQKQHSIVNFAVIFLKMLAFNRLWRAQFLTKLHMNIMQRQKDQENPGVTTGAFPACGDPWGDHWGVPCGYTRGDPQVFYFQT